MPKTLRGSLTTEGSGLSACSKLTETETDGQTDRQAGRQADRKTGRQTDRQAERRTETGRQTETETAPNNRGQWPECLVEAAAERLRPGKRQA